MALALQIADEVITITGEEGLVARLTTTPATGDLCIPSVDNPKGLAQTTMEFRELQCMSLSLRILVDLWFSFPTRRDVIRESMEGLFRRVQIAWETSPEVAESVSLILFHLANQPLAVQVSSMQRLVGGLGDKLANDLAGATPANNLPI